MRRFLLVFMMFAVFAPVQSASADWRWAEPKFKIKRVKPVCHFHLCRVLAKIQARANHRARVRYYHARKRNEWRFWTHLYIPRCTWYGESGYGPQYARYRYTLPNSTGSGALGKYQFMPKTYYSSGKYDDWSPLDQEIAARVEYWKHGVFPWQNCTR